MVELDFEVLFELLDVPGVVFTGVLDGRSQYCGFQDMCMSSFGGIVDPGTE